MATVNREYLKILMDKDGWTKVKFAQEVGISISYLSDILAGRSRLERSPDLIKTMAVALNVPKSMIEQPNGRFDRVTHRRRGGHVVSAVPAISAWRSVQCVGDQHHNCRGAEWSCSCPCHLSNSAEAAQSDPVTATESSLALREHGVAGSDCGTAASSVHDKARVSGKWPQRNVDSGAGTPPDAGRTKAS